MMRHALLGAALAVVAWLACGWVGRDSNHVLAQSNAAEATSLTAFTTDAGDNAQVLYVLDPLQRSLAVYRIDLQRGTVALTAARNIRFDLLLEEFNCLAPDVAAIRTLTNR